MERIWFDLTREEIVDGASSTKTNTGSFYHFHGAYGAFGSTHYGHIALSANGTCTTPSLSGANAVQLPMVNQNDFNGQDTFAGETDFDLTFTNCSTNMYRIHYKIYSPNPADNVGNPLALLSLSPSSTAQGIKLQLLERNTNTPITLDQFKVAPQYTGQQTSFTIPFRARYYQAAPTMTGGTVRATALFQIIYQ